MHAHGRRHRSAAEYLRRRDCYYANKKFIEVPTRVLLMRDQQLDVMLLQLWNSTPSHATHVVVCQATPLPSNLSMPVLTASQRCMVMRGVVSQDWNADGSHGHELAMNHMGDVAPEEHRAMLAGNRRARAAWAADPRQVSLCHFGASLDKPAAMPCSVIAELRSQHANECRPSRAHLVH